MNAFAAPILRPNCGDNPSIICLAINSDLIVLATITSIDDSIEHDYNVTAYIDCVYASFYAPPLNASTLVDSNVTIANWGDDTLCSNGGTTGVINSTYILFLSLVEPLSGNYLFFALRDVCYGAWTPTQNVTGGISEALKIFPQNSIYSNSSQCQLTKFDMPPTKSSSSSLIQFQTSSSSFDAPTGIISRPRQTNGDEDGQVSGGQIAGYCIGIVSAGVASFLGLYAFNSYQNRGVDIS